MCPTFYKVVYSGYDNFSIVDSKGMLLRQIKLLQPSQRDLVHPPSAWGHPVDKVVVEGDGLAVRREADVELDHPGAIFGGQPDCL